MNYTTQFPTELITETLIMPVDHPKLASMNFSRFIHFPALIATICFASIFALIFYFTYSADNYTYKYSNGITYRTYIKTGQVDYQWPGEKAWRSVTIPTPGPAPLKGGSPVTTPTPFDCRKLFTDDINRYSPEQLNSYIAQCYGQNPR